jgi:REP element-mobilizing transposase RayT
MPSKKQKTPLVPGKYYHIYNRGNNREKLFFKDHDYLFFLEKYRLLVAPYVSTYAFCLLPNHFHFLIYLKDKKEFSKIKVSNQLRKVFITYTRRVNLQQDRTGGLFTKNYQRIEVKDSLYLKNLVIYIHRNPQSHGIMTDFQNYKYSSFNGIISEEKTLLARNQIFEWFDGKEDFLRKHFINNYILPIYDIHYLERDGVPGLEMESLRKSHTNLSTAFF